jgi:Bacterial Ig domain
MRALNVGVGSALMLVAAVSVLPAKTAGAHPPRTTVLIPADSATVSGTSQVLDATASSGVTQVQYEITGGTLSDSMIATGTLTIYGWLAQWNTTSVANGSYTLQSVASHADGLSTSSSPVKINVNNPPPSTTVLIPSSGGTVDTSETQVFDAVASPGVTQVSIEVTGPATGPTTTLTATPTIYGWIATHPAYTCPDCVPIPVPFSIQSVAAYSGGVSGTSQPVNVTFIAYLPIGTF